MATIKTSALSGPALDWAVAKAEGVPVSLKGDRYDTSTPTEPDSWYPNNKVMVFRTDMDSEWGEWDGPTRDSFISTDWLVAGPIIEREKVEITPWGVNGEWRARDFYEPSPGVPCAEQYGPTPQIAAMRCLVASKLGDEVDVPDALINSAPKGGGGTV